MKATSTLWLLLFVLLTSCFSSKDYVTDYDYNYTGSFRKYKTFAFVRPTEMENETLVSVLNSTIGARLGSQGFQELDNKPDMLVSYKIFTDSVRYRGYVQPEFDYWLNRTGRTYRNDEGEIEREQEKDETYNMVKYAENNGMLVIYVIDSRRGHTIWQGYTAAAFDLESPTFESDITRAAYRVMNEFKIINRMMQ
ncbi:DUF4136 domain-containing protein [Algoriphagus sanaruensis]|uniref:DUF4136 domain-containing protein n=1 Tax=Algoriphagus sanaruensis TaxID=1727163 RepID=A0A142EQN7_9BACT|nr:DUF4136 domain-containing protein [Algoriphagus sanaruensis]AMQ57442.1 hypothetical protein AO498_13420 [Algoriphagus sanaruensis]